MQYKELSAHGYGNVTALLAVTTSGILIHYPCTITYIHEVKQGLESRFAGCEHKSLHGPKFLTEKRVLTEKQFQFSCLKGLTQLRSAFHGK